MLVLGLLSSFYPTWSVAEAGSVGAAREMTVLWEKIQTISTALQQVSYVKLDSSEIYSLLSNACTVQSSVSLQAKVLKAKARQYDTDYGLNLRGGYTSADINDNSGDPGAYLELSWDLWRQGYAENKRRARSFEQQAAVSQLKASFAQLKRDAKCRRYHINEAFTGLLSHLLTLKLALMEPVYRIEKRAYFKNWSYLDDLLVSDQDLRLIRDELQYLSSSPFLDTALNQVQNLPVIDLDIQSIINDIRNDDRLLKLQKLQKQTLTDKLKVSDDDRLRLFVRKQFDVANNNDASVVAGFRFTIPLKKRKNLAEQYQLAHLESEFNLQAWERTTRTRAAYQSFREQLQRTVKQQYRVLRANERIRRIRLQKKLNDEVHIATVVTRLRTSLDASIELVRAKEELYRRVNEVLLLASVKFKADYLKTQTFNENTYRARSGERSIYIWSKGFNKFDNQTILAFLKVKNISRVLLSAGRKVKRDKMRAFIKLAHQQHIKVESIVGPNNLFFSKQHNAAAIAVESVALLSDAVHLDIEPHTFPGYKQNKQSYLKQYIDMLRTIRKQSPDIVLSVAVPFHWPASTYSVLDTLVDRVYVMAYGSTKINTVLRRLQPVLNNVAHHKIIPVLRVSDFGDEWQIEKMIDLLQQRSGLHAFSLHTFRRFVQKAGK